MDLGLFCYCLWWRRSAVRGAWPLATCFFSYFFFYLSFINRLGIFFFKKGERRRKRFCLLINKFASIDYKNVFLMKVGGGGKLTMGEFVCVCVDVWERRDPLMKTVPSDLLDIQNRIWMTSSQNSWFPFHVSECVSLSDRVPPAFYCTNKIQPPPLSLLYYYHYHLSPLPYLTHLFPSPSFHPWTFSILISLIFLSDGKIGMLWNCFWYPQRVGRILWWYFIGNEIS